MKRSSKTLLFSALLAFFLAAEVCAEEIEVVPTATPKPAPTRAIRETAEFKELNAKYEKVKSEIAELRQKMDGISASIEEIKGDIKSLEESNMEIKTISRDIEAYRDRITAFEEKYGKDKEKVDKSLAEFEGMKDDFKSRIDKMQGWNDILDVLKKQINNNELEIARLKKNISDLKHQYGDDDNIINQVVKWPYLPLTAVVISVIAFTIAVTK